MKKWLHILGGLVCAALAFWAYQISGNTRMSLAELHAVESDIREEREHIEILRAEWAILNRPERLRHLVQKNAGALGLIQISAQNYGGSTQVPYTHVHTQNQDYIDPSDIDRILQDLIASGEIEIQ